AYDRATRSEFTADDERLLQGFAASAAVAVATAQRFAEQGLRRSIEAAERERTRWARELHDETLQELAGLRVLLSAARRSPEEAAESTLYRLVQESLTNIVRHAGAENVHIVVRDDGDHVIVEIHDDGRGFDPAARHEGFGVVGMRERVELAGGTLQIRSGPGE